MTDARIARSHPGLSETESLVALLTESLELARGIELTRNDLGAAGGDDRRVRELLTAAGMAEEIESAGKTVQATVVDILARLSERDLQAGLDQGLLSPDDHAEALTILRTLSLARGRSPLQERAHDREG